MYTRLQLVSTRHIYLSTAEFIWMQLPGVRGRRQIESIHIGFGWVAFHAKPHGRRGHIAQVTIDVDGPDHEHQQLERGDLQYYFAQMPEAIVAEVLRSIHATAPDRLSTETYGPPAYISTD